MRLLSHTVWMMSLRGKRSIHRRPLVPPEEAARFLRQLTGQDFGLDADKWAEWLRDNRKGLYKRRPPRASP
jgi:hypothetical protein